MYGFQRGDRLWNSPQAPYQIFKGQNTRKDLLLKAYDHLSLEEVDSLLKSAIRMHRSSGRVAGPLLAVQVGRCRAAQGYDVEWVFANTRGRDIQEFATDSVLSGLKVGLEEYELVQKPPIYENKANIVKVEIVEATIGLPPRPVVIKLYHSDFANIERILQEALLQVKAASAFTCRLLDISIRRGFIDFLEVGLVMERLEGDLEADVTYRKGKNKPYTEGEMRGILECVAEALLYAKLRVKAI